MNAEAAKTPVLQEPTIATRRVENALNGNPVTLCYALWHAQAAKRGTVVAVHGLTRQKRDFDYIARYLAEKGYDVYAVDAPGRGGSQWLENHEDYTLFNFGRIFTAFMDQQDLSGVHWLGTSMGGLLAMMISLQERSKLFKSVTLNDITHKPNRDALERIAQYMTETFPVFDTPSVYTTFLRQNLPLGDVPEDIWTHYTMHQLKKVDGGYTFHFDPKLVRRAVADLRADVDITEGMKNLSCPIALVAGSVSDLCTAEEIESLKQLRPDAKIHIVPQAGHVPALADDASQQFIFEHISKA